MQEWLWPLEIRNYIFRPMRMTDAILPGSPPRGNIKGHAYHFSLSLLASQLASSRTKPANMTEHFLSLSCRPFEQDRPVNMTEHTYSLFASLQQEEPANIRDHIHSSSLTLLHWLSLTYFEQSAKHNEETSSNLWTVGVWEIIRSSFIFPSKPTDPWRNKLNIFNSCF